MKEYERLKMEDITGEKGRKRYRMRENDSKGEGGGEIEK